MAKNQNEKKELKAKATAMLKAMVEAKFEGTPDEPVTTDVVKGFVFKSEGEYIEVSAVVKTAKFDLDEAHAEYLQKKADAEKREADRLAAKAKREAKAKSKD